MVHLRNTPAEVMRTDSVPFAGFGSHSPSTRLAMMSSRRFESFTSSTPSMPAKNLIRMRIDAAVMRLRLVVCGLPVSRNSPRVYCTGSIVTYPDTQRETVQPPNFIFCERDSLEVPAEVLRGVCQKDDQCGHRGDRKLRYLERPGRHDSVALSQSFWAATQGMSLSAMGYNIRWHVDLSSGSSIERSRIRRMLLLTKTLRCVELQSWGHPRIPLFSINSPTTRVRH